MIHPPMLQAHRGVSTEYPENTLAAFEAASNRAIRRQENEIDLDFAGKIQ